MKLIHIPLLFAIAFSASIVASCSGRKAHSGRVKNEIIITADSAINSQLIRVEWVSPGLTPIPVYAEGKALDVELPQTDKDAFDVYVGTRIIGSGGVNRGNAGGGNSFHFHIGQQGRSETLDLRVSGPDSANGFFLKRYVRDMTGSISRIDYFDHRGFKVIETFDKLSRTGELEASNRIEFTYRPDGKKTKQVFTVSSPEGVLRNKVENTYQYDEMGREKEQTSTFYSGNGVMSSGNLNRYIYDDAGRMKEKEFQAFGPDGTLASHFFTEYLYNERGINIGEILFTGNRVKLNYLEKRYNAEGTIVAESVTEYLPDGSVRSYHGREYDNKGKILREF